MEKASKLNPVNKFGACSQPSHSRWKKSCINLNLFEMNLEKKHALCYDDNGISYCSVVRLSYVT